MTYPAYLRRHYEMADMLCTIMVLCKGKLQTGKPYWAYLCIKPSKAKAFRDARIRGYFQLEDYGTLIEWGEGAEPPSDVQERMTREYGMRQDFEQQLMTAIEQQGG